MKQNKHDLGRIGQLFKQSTGLATILLSIVILAAGCRKHFPDDDNVRVDKKLITDNLVSPVAVVSAHDGSKRLFVVDQIGKIWVIDKHGNRLPEPFLDVSNKLVTLNPNNDERGLLGLAFHPNYKYNGKFYIYYSAPPRPGGPAEGVAWNNLARLSEFKVSQSNGNIADINSERSVLQLDDPQSNHNGGTIAFSPKDGYLYIAIGDGGGANDTPAGHVPDWYLPNAGGNGQDVEANLFGNILRINVNSGNPYSVPEDNPFVGRPGRDEVYAYGLRNPYRFSIDRKGAHEIYAGDVGQLLYEEINVIKKGGNYGWNVKEGFSCFNAASSLTPFPTCPNVDNFGNLLIDPVIVLNNFRNPAGGRTATAIIGGNIYRGNDINQFKGKYIFGTYAQSSTTTDGELLIAEPRGSGQWPYEEISLESSPNDIGYLLKGMGEDEDGELYLTTSEIGGPRGNSGKVFKLVKAVDKKYK
ncbi:MAG: PQQ-dependent sugar dehydrogenase [Ferruginibacter sp.]